MKELLENNRIRLRAIEPEDIDVLYKWENNSTLWKYGASISPFSRFAIREYLINSGKDIYENRQLRLIAELKDKKEAIGTIDLYDFDPFHRRAGIGILVDEDYQNKGYATDMLNLITSYCFNFLNLHQLYAFIPEDNNKSIALFNREGYAKTAVLKQWLSADNGFSDVVIMQKISIK